MRYLIAFFLLTGNFICAAPPVQQEPAKAIDIIRESEETPDDEQNIALYYSPRCPYSQKVLSYLKRSGIKITLKNVIADPTAKEELRLYGGRMIVPCLIVDKQPIYNADDIIDWLSTHQQDVSKTTN